MNEIGKSLEANSEFYRKVLAKGSTCGSVVPKLVVGSRGFSVGLPASAQSLFDDIERMLKIRPAEQGKEQSPDIEVWTVKVRGNRVEMSPD